MRTLYKLIKNKQERKVYMNNSLLNNMFDTQMEILKDLYFKEKLRLPLKTKADIYLAKELNLEIKEG
jgi:hypothetical protein|tara:strand:- start:337 stop:537 length:201 start_codon:yes stop_codon:yes gene_type:complete